MHSRGSAAVLDIPPWGDEPAFTVTPITQNRPATPTGHVKSGQALHTFDDASARFAETVFRFVHDRLSDSPPAIDSIPTAAALRDATGEAITTHGMGTDAAFDQLRDLLLARSFSVTHPRALSFVNHSPAITATLADIALSASSVFADWWLDGAGAIHAENQALRWLADLAGLPATAGGTFLSGGTVANLTALHVARISWLRNHGRNGRLAIAATREAHSSIRLAARVLDVDLITIPGDSAGRLTGTGLASALTASGAEVFAVVATAGCTNSGAIDDLAPIGRFCRETGIWFHVDAAYGGGALASTAARPQFDGIELADSLVIDPHKWLFAPVDCSALLYRDPELSRRANTQAADYLDVVDGEQEWNPSDYGLHMTRRARGVPLWFTLAAHGTVAFEEAIDLCLKVARDAATAIVAADHVELVTEPNLSVVLFRRIGWNRDEYLAWSRELERTGLGQVVPTSWEGEPVLRICVINPRTSVEDIKLMLETLR